MARHTFAGGPSDYVLVTTSGTWRNAGPSTCTVWSAETGGTQVTDLLIDGQAATAVRLGSTGRIPSFEGPDGVEELWLEVPGVPARVRLTRFGAQGPAGPGADVTGAEIEAARDEAQAAKTAAEAARTAAESAAAAAEAGGTSTDAVMAARLVDPASQSRKAVAKAAGETVVLPAPTDSTPFRTVVRAKQVTTSRPFVAIGDSHTDEATSATNFFARLRTLHSQPGQGLEGIDPNGISVRGQNGQRLSTYLANLGSTNGWNSVVALNPLWLLACWLTNDVRQGALGTTVADIRSNGSALLLQLIDLARADLPNARMILRIPVPYTQQNGGQNYITDGTNVNPAGLAQIYTDGVRLAHYDAVAARPGVLLYDPQTRFFGTTSPAINGGANSGYYADQIHQNVNGYRAEADDFAAWVAAQEPFNTAAATEARIVQNPTTPWAAYHRVPEDTDRYVKVADTSVVTAASGATSAIIGPSFPGAIVGNIARRDILVLYGIKHAVELTATPTASAANTSLGSLPALPATAAAGTRAAVYRRITTPDDALNVVLRDRSWRYKRTGYVSNGSTTFLDLESRSYSENPVLNASTWATELVSGDRVYVEGRVSTPLIIGTDTTSVAASGNAVRLQGSLQTVDWSTLVGKAVVVVSSTHA